MITNFGFLNFGPVSFILTLIVLAVLVFEVMMIISAIRNPKISQKARILWVVGMLIIHPFVAIVYYLSDYKKAK